MLPPANPMHAAVIVMTPRTLALPTDALLLPAPPRPRTTELFVLLLMTLLVAIESMEEKYPTPVDTAVNVSTVHATTQAKVARGVRIHV